MDLKVIHLVALSILALTGYTQAGCITKQYVNGCSIPFGFQFYYKREFTPSCNRHDVCYSCGRKYGWTRLQCDNAFRRDMENACTRKFGKWKRSLEQIALNMRHLVDLGAEGLKLLPMDDGLKKCKKAAEVYCLGVRFYGRDYYARSSPSWCDHPCAREEGNPF